jgi:hypothetical protein
MTYRVVYEVLDDSLLPHKGGLGLLVVVLVWLGVFVAVHLFGKSSPEQRRKMRWAWLPVGLLAAVAVWLIATRDFPSYADQRQCREWVRTGAFEVVEGRVSDLSPPDRVRRPRHPRIDFRVGGVPFSYRYGQLGRGGFQGTFTAADAQAISEGLPVRIAHRDGRILRIETAEP